MKYQKVQNFRIAEPEKYQTDIATDRSIKTLFVDMKAGLITLKPGFCFQPSGPVFKTKTFLRAAAFHDAGYMLIRTGHLEPFWKEPFDDLLYQICIEDKMSNFRAKYVHKAVLTFGDTSIDPANRKKIKTAP